MRCGARRFVMPFVAAIVLFAVFLASSPIGAQERRAVRITPGEKGAVVLRLRGVGRPPARALNPAQAEAAARSAAEVDAFSRVAYLLGRVDRTGNESIVSSFRGRFKGIHVEKSERLPDGSARAEVSIIVPAEQVPELLERIDEYIGDLEAQSESLRAAQGRRVP